MKYFVSRRNPANLLLLSRVALLSVGCLLASSAWNSSVAQTSLINETAIAQAATDLPQDVRNAVINDAASRADLPASQFTVVTATQQDWPDGCLGLAEPGVGCTQAIVPGWSVTVSANQQEWIYRTDATGSQVRLAQETTAPSGDQAYTDIQGHWAQSCIQRLSQQNILSGYPDNTFRPNNSITRAEYAALVNQAFPNVQSTRDAVNFTDVPVYYWGQEAIQTAYSKGFLSGYPNQQFRPNDLVSRVEAYVALASGLDYTIPDATQRVLSTAYTDASTIPDYAEGAIAAATRQGIVVNANPQTSAFNPASSATRAQVAASLCQIKYEGAGIPDGYVVEAVDSPEESDRVSLEQTCENTTSGFTVDYPAGWMTNTQDIAPSCFVFDPNNITLQERASSLDEAIHLRVDSVPYSRATRQDDPTETEISRQSTTVNGREAILTESESNGRGLIPEGVTSYRYIINLGNGETMLASTYDYAGQPYERNKEILDQMISTLTFN